ncbi:heavy metal translocating P-type ATPase [Treponema sp. Marseille-Q4523]|uniref:heavy metal translocating P-type ATPase n=1 Tax=Treponema sp. Marseille-Q4523 TaxID=2810610 RepID=UPI001960539F|nr:heavy metal translocating P-type ATPase [Treponema sp. Marseille-Q4523]MBM7023744.1 cadmium-translocating P-type ATPase [Treponema sp. Marseille-Q4523]
MSHECHCHACCKSEHEHEHTHGHEHEEESELSVREIVIAAVLFALGLIVEHAHPFRAIDVSLGKFASADELVSIVLLLAAYLVCGRSVVIDAVKNIIKGNFFDEKFLMSVASLGAVAVGQYPEAVGVMLLYQIGEYAQDKAVDKSRDSIQSLMEIRPDKAFVKRGGKIIEVSPDDVNVGETILVKPGERIPIDGTVVQGKSFLDTSALTGEAVPRRVFVGSDVMAGAINTDSVIEIETTKIAGESAAARIIELVEKAQEKKAKSERFITRFSKAYTPIVCVAAVLLALIPSLITGDAHTWVYRALIFLVVSCPCALVISVPLGFFSGIGTASKNGILIKGSECVETLARTRTAVFDKTGTLTKGVFAVTGVHPTDEERIPADELIAIAAHAETYSNHPISNSIKAAHSGACCNLVKIADAEEISGEGISVVLDGKRVLAGNMKLMESHAVEGIVPCSLNDFGTVVHVAVDGLYAGHIVIADQTKDDAAFAVKKLRKLGVKKIVMLTGDNRETAEEVASEIGVDTVFSELLPQDKVDKVEALLAELGEKPRRPTLLFAGDGINDAPVLARADTGIAMGGLGSDAAIESADAVIMTDEPAKIADAISISRKTVRIVTENIVVSLIVKIGIMALGAFGIANMWTAVFGDTGVALLAVANSMRVMLWKKRG